MKTEVFKKLIKEAVREVLREELAEVLTEAPKKQPTRAANYQQYAPIKSTPIRSTGDPIADLLAETRADMVGSGNAGHYQDMSQFVEAPGLGQSTFRPTMVEESFSRPEPGLDISQFDFVNKAAAVFKASQEKDKQRFGA